MSLLSLTKRQQWQLAMEQPVLSPRWASLHYDLSAYFLGIHELLHTHTLQSSQELTATHKLLLLTSDVYCSMNTNLSYNSTPLPSNRMHPTVMYIPPLPQLPPEQPRVQSPSEDRKFPHDERQDTRTSETEEGEVCQEEGT